ncbi:MAG: type II toxin-antitoxin system Phd/YefM family antitoxin [Candidatus Aminicenantes bacterium]|nr:type II toxin-antitoxin system Phd/YefM family antitoxin [Candidatus Aminicenantes bacterium]
MSLRTTYSHARANLAELLDRVSLDRETVVIERRRGKGRVAMIAADELDSILETAHLLRSPKNAQRLLSALRGALAGEGASMTLNELRAEVGLEPKEP